MSKVAIVISDLHIGAGELDDCDKELENLLLSFIDNLSSRNSAVELIINGDFLDFAQASPWSGSDLESISPLGIPLCFTEEQSVAKLEAVINSHPAVFKSLGDFLVSDYENKLVINPGNHDVDFFWPGVRSAFINKVCERTHKTIGRVFFNLKQSYSPERAQNVWIEHGNQYDPANCFYVNEYDPWVGSHVGRKLYWSTENPPIIKDRVGQERLYECLGTRFLIKFLNKLDADYPFVDNVKPFSRFLNIFGASAFIRGYGPIRAALAVWRMLGYLGGSLITDPTGLLEERHAGMEPPARLLSEKIKGMSEEQRFAFHEGLRNRGFDLNRPALMYLQDAELRESLLMFLSDNLDLLTGLPDDNSAYLESVEGSKGGGYLTLTTRYDVDETKELIRAARRIIGENDGIDTVIMGHTHEPVNLSPQLQYLNTGSWTRNYNLADENIRPWDILRDDSYKWFPYELSYIEIQPGIKNSVRMLTYARKDRRGNVTVGDLSSKCK